jgi:hypothetical protein
VFITNQEIKKTKTKNPQKKPQKQKKTTKKQKHFVTKMILCQGPFNSGLLKNLNPPALISL